MTAGPVAPERDFLRSCHRLLYAYPGHYRRQHGAEIATTLLDMRSPGQRRPNLGEAAHLLLSGLRQRVRLPAGRPLAVVAAVLIAATMGAFGAAAGSWTAAQTFAAIPDDAAMVGLAQQASGVGNAPLAPEPYRHASSWWHESGHMSTDFVGEWDAVQARHRFQADGWTVSSMVPRGGKGVISDPDTQAEIEYPLYGYEFTAQAGGLTLVVSGHVSDPPARLADTRASVSVAASAQSTPVFLPLVVLGTIAGLIAGWLLAATMAYRLRRTPLGRRRAARVLSTLAIGALALPAVALYGNVMRAFRYDGEPYGVMTVHSAFTPGAYYPFGPEWQVMALTLAGIVIAAVSILLATPTAQPRTMTSPVPSEG